MDNNQPAPVYVQPQPDPALAIMQQQTANQNIEQMKVQAMQDTAHLMQQYGILSALSGGAQPMTMTPASTVAVSPASLIPGSNVPGSLKAA